MTDDIAARPRPRRRFRLSLRATVGLVVVAALTVFGYGERFDPVRGYRRDVRDRFGMRRYDAVRRAAWGGQGVDRETALVELIDTLDDPDPLVRRSAVWQLGMFGAGARRAVPLLTGLLKDEHTWLRAETAARLAAILETSGRDDPAAAGIVDSLAALLDDPDPAVRLAAACGLGRCPKGRLPESTRRAAVATLLRFQHDQIGNRHMEAGFGLRDLGETPSALPDFVAAVRSEDGPTRSAAVEGVLAAGLLATRPDLNALAAIADDPSFDHTGDYALKGSRVRAAEVLCLLGHEAEGLPLLRRAQTSGDPSVRDAATRTLARLKSNRAAAGGSP